ncbi:flagellar motor switch protein FliN [Sphingosinithalassobacter portus]|uniref:flagellar motor switch protein FliN n=1 Tax=Stakelama portus TaxID=2676234 RepID=UPI003B834EFB
MMEKSVDPQDIVPTDAAQEQAAPALEDFEPQPQPAPSAEPPAEGLEAVFDVPVKVQAVLGRTRMPVGDLLQLRSGHVLELDRRVGEPVDIFVNDRLIARGEIVLIDGALGVTLTEVVRQEI